MSDLTEGLMRDHACIERVLDMQDRVCGEMERGADVPIELLENVVSFLRDFADGHHHHKEEDLLFPALAEAGMPRDAGPIGVMLHEHDLARELTLRIIESLAEMRGRRAGARDAFCTAARAYAQLLRAHIQKENGVLFPMAERCLASTRKSVLAELLDAADVRYGDPAVRHSDLLEPRPTLSATS